MVANDYEEGEPYKQRVRTVFLLAQYEIARKNSSPHSMLVPRHNLLMTMLMTMTGYMPCLEQEK